MCRRDSTCDYFPTHPTMTLVSEFKQLPFWSRNSTLSVLPVAAAWWIGNRFFQSLIWISACNSWNGSSSTSRELHLAAWCTPYVPPSSPEMREPRACYLDKREERAFVQRSPSHKDLLHWTTETLLHQHCCSGRPPSVAFYLFRQAHWRILGHRHNCVDSAEVAVIAARFHIERLHGKESLKMAENFALYEQCSKIIDCVFVVNKVL